MLRSVIMVALGAISYGMLSSFAKISYTEGYTPAEITFMQALLGAAVLWIMVVFSQFKNGRPGFRGGWKYMLAGTMLGASAYTYYLSVKYIPASLAIILLMQVTWMSILLDWIIYKVRPLLMEMLVSLVVLFGTILAGNLQSAGQLHFSPEGIVYALLAALFYALYVVLNTRMGKNAPMLTKTALLMTGSEGVILLINARPLMTGIHLDAGLFKWGSFLALFGTVIPPVLFAKGMPKIGAGLSSVLLTLEMPVAVMCAHVILKEDVSFLQIVGIMIMLAAIIFMNLYKLKVEKRNQAASLAVTC